MKILIIAASNHYRDWIMKTYSDILLYYKTHSKHKVKLIYSDTHYTKHDFFKDEPTIVVYFDTTTVGSGNKFAYIFIQNKIPVVFCGLDLFRYNECICCKWIKKCDAIIHFGKASKLLTSYQKKFPTKYISCFDSRFINTNVFKKWRSYNDKQFDILLYGSRSNIVPYQNTNIDKVLDHNEEPYFYPFRMRLEQLLIKNRNKYKLNILPEKTAFDAIIANKKLSQLINKSRLCVATSTRYDVMMHKYLEIAASHTAILGNIPTDYVELFKNKIIEINMSMSDNEIIETIDLALNKHKKLKKITGKLYNKIIKHHNFDKMVVNFDEKFEHITNLYYSD